MPYTYQWDGGTGFQTTQTATGLCCPGIYNVTVRDANSCEATLSVDICVTGVETINFVENISLYPNPTTGEFIIEIEISKPVNLEIKLLNVIGQIIYREKLNKFSGVYQKTIDIGKQAIGIYTLQLISGEAVINKKIVLEK